MSSTPSEIIPILIPAPVTPPCFQKPREEKDPFSPRSISLITGENAGWTEYTPLREESSSINSGLTQTAAVLDSSSHSSTLEQEFRTSASVPGKSGHMRSDSLLFHHYISFLQQMSWSIEALSQTKYVTDSSESEISCSDPIASSSPCTRKLVEESRPVKTAANVNK